MGAKLLAGPILRRTTKNRVCVWLAMSVETSLQLTVLDGKLGPLGQGKQARLGEQCVKLGDKLYVYLLQVRAENAGGFPRDALMYYRIDDVSADGKTRTPLFSDDDLKKLVYGAHPYPSFFIPTKLNNLLHGSCRKPHGAFHGREERLPDALCHGHALLQKTHSKLAERPAVLLFTGDQIYADDVAISLLAVLRPQAAKLTGKQETLPMADGGSSPGARLDPSKIGLHGRKRVLAGRDNAARQASGFSSGEAENHLFSFGEFAAMYIYAFGNLPEWDPVWDWGPLQAIGVAQGEEDDAEEAWAEQRVPLSYFHETLPDIRRLMANVPTYMLLDDHDVTDDWNITRDWYDAVRQSPLGRRIVSNAIAAYWGFQAWGNDPDNFDKDLILSITQQLNDASNNADIGERYDLHTWKARGWGFSIPTEPPIIAMDSRTQRQYDKGCDPAELLDRYALDWLRVEWAKLKTGQAISSGTCPVLIAATPVMGYSVVEAFQRAFLRLAISVDGSWPVRNLERWLGHPGWFTDCVVDKLDMESWSANEAGFYSFMITLSERMNISRCVFLSGDVHYGFSASASFRHRDRTLHICQLTSSALSNETSELQSRILEETAKQETDSKPHRNWVLCDVRRWRVEERLLPAKNCDSRLSAKCNLGLVEFADGVPVRHTLLNGAGNVVYRLPPPGAGKQEPVA